MLCINLQHAWAFKRTVLQLKTSAHEKNINKCVDSDCVTCFNALWCHCTKMWKAVFSRPFVSLLRFKPATEHLETERQRVRDGVRETGECGCHSNHLVGRNCFSLAFISSYWASVSCPLFQSPLSPLFILLFLLNISGPFISSSPSCVLPFLLLPVLAARPLARPTQRLPSCHFSCLSRVECRVVLPSLSSWPFVHFYNPALTDPPGKLETC